MADRNARIWTGSEWENISAPVSVPNAVAVWQSTAPSSPITGQIWIDSDNNSMYVWSGSSWISVALDLSSYATTDSPTFTGNVVLPSTTSIGNVSSTEIGYLDGTTSSVQSQLTAANLMTVQLERSGGYTGAVGQLAAFGNGSADGYMIFPFDVDLMYAAMRVNAVHTGTTTVQLNIDGTNQGASYQLSCTGANSTDIENYTSSPKRITAGQGFNFAMTSVSGTLGTTVINAIFAKV